MVVQFSSVAQSCLTFCNPMNRSTPGLPIHHHLPEFTQTHVHRVRDASHLILCCPLLLLPPIPPRIRVFSNESTLRIGWPKYWSFSFSIIPSKAHPGLISFRMDWLDLLTSLHLHRNTHTQGQSVLFYTIAHYFCFSEYSSLYYSWLFVSWLCALWNLSSSTRKTRDQMHPPAVEVQSPNPWTAREFPVQN